MVDKLVEKCSKNIYGNEMIHNDSVDVCNSCTIYIVLFVITFLLIISISSTYVLFSLVLKKINIYREKFKQVNIKNQYWYFNTIGYKFERHIKV